VLIDSGDWRVFTGNEMGCLLIWWMIHVYKSKGDGPGKVWCGLGAVAWFMLTVGWVSFTIALLLSCRHHPRPWFSGSFSLVGFYLFQFFVCVIFSSYVDYGCDY